jgi:putative ubiquitin-RnfH superfamily antitoxin RatB of RatAB toxin-antitoxin module
VVGKESVTVPAGTFEATKIELKDFFGNQKTVWLAADKPGIYVKVVDQGNTADDKDKTEVAHELVKVVAGQ